PATGPGGGVLPGSATLLRLDARALLRPIPTGRGERGRDRQAARVELLSEHSIDIGARGLPRASLAPGHGKAEPVGGPTGVRHELLRRGLGPLRRADDARVGLLRRP